MGARARSFAREHFSLAAMVDRTLAMYSVPRAEQAQ
jgi:hypothetical protein